MPTVLVVDSDNLIHRGYHAIPPMKAPDGTPNNALRGFCSGILGLLDLVKPDIVVCAFDGGVPTWRKAARPEYKANRKEKDEDLATQLEICRLIICPTLGFHVAYMKETEADDLVFTVAHACGERDWKCELASGDKDLAQCLQINGTTLWRPGKTKEGGGWTKWTAEDALREWDVTPTQIPDLLAIIGDSSDNLSGIQGAGPKTASKWLKTYGDIPNIVMAKDSLEPVRLRAKIDQDLLERNLLVTKSYLCDYKTPETAKEESPSAKETLKELGLFKIATMWEKRKEKKQEAEQQSLF